MIMDITSISFAVNGVIIAWLTYQEARMQSLKSDIKDRLQIQESINREAREDFKLDIARLEGKIDTLTLLLLKVNNAHQD